MHKKNKSFFKYPLLGIALIISSSVYSIWITPVIAGVTFKPPPPGAQAPQRSSEGGSRDGNICGFGMKVSNSASATPLIPTSNIGFTVAKRPTIFVYLPGSKAQKALFTLQDDGSKPYYQTTLTLPQKPGVMEVKLPTSVAAMKTGKNYKWSLVMICTEELDTDIPWVGGWIRRVEADRSLIGNEFSYRGADVGGYQILGAALDGRPLIQVWSFEGEWLWVLCWSFISSSLTWQLLQVKSICRQIRQLADNFNIKPIPGNYEILSG